MFSDVQSLMGSYQDGECLQKKHGNVPVSDMILVHELDTLVKLAKLHHVVRTHRTHLAYLGKESDKFSIRLKLGVVKRT
jgi:hypothetical protein